MPQIIRAVYRAQCKPGQEAATVAAFTAARDRLQAQIPAGRLLTISLFHWRRHFFAYWESIGEPATPDDLFGDLADLLELWPGAAEPRPFVPMMDIFHGLTPQSVEGWRRQRPPEHIQGRITRLKPEMVSSYIFYHYQLQEERPGHHDKYWLISLHEDLLFFYQEQPPFPEPRPGKLTTNNTPDDWQAVMFPHFRLWDDAPKGEEIWRQVELILHLL
jgi:hypothetical protein